jgi:hypothetical protein
MDHMCANKPAAGLIARITQAGITRPVIATTPLQYQTRHPHVSLVRPRAMRHSKHSGDLIVPALSLYQLRRGTLDVTLCNTSC